MIQYHTEQSEHVRGQKITKPIMTIDAANRYGLTAATLVKYYGTDQHGQKIQDPLHTVTAKARSALGKHLAALLWPDGKRRRILSPLLDWRHSVGPGNMAVYTMHRLSPLYPWGVQGYTGYI